MRQQPFFCRPCAVVLPLVCLSVCLCSWAASAEWKPGRAWQRIGLFTERESSDVTATVQPVTLGFDDRNDEESPSGIVPMSYVEPVSYETSTSDVGVSHVMDDGDVEWCEEWSYQLLPDGLMYKSYLAGPREPRMSSVWLYERGRGWVWETTLGGRVGIWRYGTTGPIQPQGYQFDIEGAVFPRIDPVVRSELDAVDFRAGMLLTHRDGPLAWKMGYYHISSHLGDEYMLTHPLAQRIEYVRDSAIAGLTYDVRRDVSIYGEIGYAAGNTGGAKPLEFQFGAQYSPVIPTGIEGAPFAAANIHLLEDFDFSGNFNIVWGWQWRGTYNDHLFRAGFQYYDGNSLQTQFFNKYEQLLGLGMWYDY